MYNGRHKSLRQLVEINTNLTFPFFHLKFAAAFEPLPLPLFNVVHKRGKSCR